MKIKQLIVTCFISALIISPAIAYTGNDLGWRRTYDGSWYYIDNRGYGLKNQWLKSGDNWYYMGHDGYMLKDELLDDNGRYYAFDSNGAMLSNRWGHYDLGYYDDDHEDGVWMYFENSGRAKENGWLKDIDGNWYHFTDFMMDERWYMDNDRTYYFNDKHDGTFGAMCRGWRLIDVNENDCYAPSIDDKDIGWFYFEDSGKMVKDKEKRIKCADGRYYRFVFDDEGFMLDNWVLFTNDKNDEIYRFYRPFVGDRVDGWFYLYDKEYDDEGRDTEEGWYYFKNGRAYSTRYKATPISDEYAIAKIKNKYYCFDEKGKMCVGKIEADDGEYFYFNEDEYRDGSMVYGKVRLRNADDLDDDTYYFKKNGSIGKKGKSHTGEYRGYLYDNGVLCYSEDDRYEIFKVNNKYYLVNRSGRIQKTGKYRDRDNEIDYKVKRDPNGGYIIYKDNSVYRTKKTASDSNATKS